MAPFVTVAFAVGGFVVGWLTARATEWLTPPEEATPIRWRGALVRDPLVQGALALIWAYTSFRFGGNPLAALEASLLAVPLVQVAVTDLRTRYVYNYVAGFGLLIGLGLGWHVHGVAWFWSWIGAIGASVVFIGLYGLGRLMFKGTEALARGDITIAAMVGAGAATNTAYALIYGVFLSGILAAVILAITRSRRTYMPYGPGLCLGGLIALFMS